MFVTRPSISWCTDSEAEVDEDDEVASNVLTNVEHRVIMKVLYSENFDFILLHSAKYLCMKWLWRFICDSKVDVNCSHLLLELYLTT